jgi:uncharacterized protein DUF4397
MFNRTRLIASVIVTMFALTLAACGGGGSTATGSSGNASVRFINGSPDAGGIDVLVNGKAIVTNLTYSQISAYQTVLVGTSPLPQVAFVQTGTQVNIFPALSSGAAQTFQLGAAPGTNLTIVVEGRQKVVGSAGLNLGAFIEPTITNSAGTYSIVFHHASPLAALAAPNGLDVGSILLGSSPVYTRLGSILFSSSSSNQQSFFGLTSQAAVTGPPGIGFFVAQTQVATSTPVPVITPSPSPSPSATPSASPFVPKTIYAEIDPGAAPFPTPTGFPISAVDPLNVNNSLPFNNDTNLFVYVIDSLTSPTGVVLIGTFNN